MDKNKDYWKTTSKEFADFVRDSFTELMLQDMMSLFNMLKNHAHHIHELLGEVNDLKTSMNNVAVLSKRAASLAIGKKASPELIKKLIEQAPKPRIVKDARAIAE